MYKITKTILYTMPQSNMLTWEWCSHHSFPASDKEQTLLSLTHWYLIENSPTALQVKSDINEGLSTRMYTLWGGIWTIWGTVPLGITYDSPVGLAKNEEKHFEC